MRRTLTLVVAAQVVLTAVFFERSPAAQSPMPAATSAAAAPPPVAVPEGPPSWNRVTAIVDAMIADRGLDGVFLEVARGDDVLYSRAFGGVTRDTVLNVASATKWVTAWS
jgi:CubicO group peptidase (beta-lactamase class C family)